MCDELTGRQCDVIVCPHNTTAEDIKSMNPNGIVLSNGPGDPAGNAEIIENLKEIIHLNIPIFAVGLGHQLLALAHGCSTEKLKYGHRGANQPVRDLGTGRVYVVSQNHGYIVKSASIDKTVAEEIFVNAGDGTNEGLEYRGKKAFSVQFNPDVAMGTDNSGWLYDKFVGMIKNK